MLFSELRLSAPILRALEQEGYTTPTPIQQKAIPVVMAGSDVLGCAQTGTGKTAAFALPLLNRLMEAPVDKAARGPRKARVLVLAPTRELAVQIGESFATYGRDTGLSGTVIYGGVSQFHQERALRRGVDVIVATPGRLLDLMEQRLVDLSAIEALVLDEADRMLDMGFIQPIRRIAASTPSSRQTLLFSATMSKPIAQLAESLLREPVKIAVNPVASAAPKIDQSLFMIDRGRKQTLLTHLLRAPGVTRALVFTKTKHGADKVGKRLTQAGIVSETIHGNKAQNARKRALDRFRSGQARVLVATDVAARGLDVDMISHVFNMDLPMEPEAYVHRIGRTGRAGATGIAVSFCDSQERGLLRDIERLIGGKIPLQATPSLADVVMPAMEPDSRDDGDRFQGRAQNRGESRGQYGGQSGGQGRPGPRGGPQRRTANAAPVGAATPRHPQARHQPHALPEHPKHAPQNHSHDQKSASNQGEFRRPPRTLSRRGKAPRNPNH
jgi:ATP-dependent RNA helicase RhlE